MARLWSLHLEQAQQFFSAGQLLATDYAMLEGQSEWKLLPEVIALLQEAETRHAQASRADLPAVKRNRSPF